jgi:hypothetical protein
VNGRSNLDEEEVPLDVALERLRTLMARYLAEEYVQRILEAAADAASSEAAE